MSDTFVPKKGVTYFNISGKNQGVTSGQLRQTQYPQSNYYAAQSQYVGPNTGGTNSIAPSVDPYQQARDQAAVEAAKREAETRNYINSGFDSYMSGLSGMESTYNNQKNDELSSNDKIYEQIFGGLNDQKKASQDRLNVNRGVVKDRQQSSITGLQENLGETIRNTGMQLGAMGAADTSASQVMMPYAYTKIAGQEEGGIRRQANDQLFQIDQQEQDLVSKHMELWRQTEVDKETQKQNIINFYSQKLQQIQMERVNAPRQRAEALANLSANLLSEARGKLSQLEGAVLERQAAIRDSGQKTLASLGTMRDSLANTANFTPQQITYDPMQTAQVNSGTTEEMAYNPLLIAQKRRQQYLG